MNEINFKDYEFDEQLLKNVELFDEVLKELGEPILFENANFRFVQNFGLSPDYLVTHLLIETAQTKSNTLPIHIWFEANDLRIDIDGIPETFEWAKKHIEQDRNSVKELIRNLFTGYVLIDEKGSSKFIQIFDTDGKFVNCQSRNNLFHMITGRFLFRFRDYRKLYLPLFRKNN